MFDPDDYELHQAQKHACKMARERDEARVMADKLAAELAACAAVLPGAYYMDLPDGGDVPVSEQLRRMAVDAERYRYLRHEHEQMRNVLRKITESDVTYWDDKGEVRHDVGASQAEAMEIFRQARALLTPNV